MDAVTDTAEMPAFVEKRLTVLQHTAEAADRTGNWQDLTWPDSACGSGVGKGISGASEEHILAHSPQAVLRWIGAARERLRLLQVNEAHWNDVRNDREPFNAFANGDACGRYNMARRMVALDAAVFRDHPDYQSAREAP